MDGKKIVEYIPLSVMLETPDLWEFYAENITRMLRSLREAGCDPMSLSISTEDSIAPIEKRVSIVCTRMKDNK